MNRTVLQQGVFMVLLVLASLAFGWVVWPFFGAILWGTILAIVLAPLQRGALRLTRQRRTLASLTTVAVCLVIVIAPLSLLAQETGQARFDDGHSRSIGTGV